ncbi:MAG TPA: class I SAM-dependent methyltransferase [Candidatus Acidoferrum sp.]|nr:class I SAM-dependent methyltransferase [Candidatus Acidoferrum sp.]
MSEIWNKVYKSDKAFFGEEASNFALLCFNHMKMNNVNRILELGAGHGRDSTFFASNGIEVEALDYSIIAIELLDKITKEKRLPIKPQIFDVKRALPFPNGYFDAVYSHMLLNMRFSVDELHFVFSEMRRVLKPNGFNFFSVRNQNDKSYSEGVQIDKGIYDISGFQVQFFTEEEIRDLTKGFEILCIAEEYEEPVTLYLVFTNKL